MGLPTDDKARKALPIWTGFIMYFPDVPAAVAEVSRLGNEQHNPGEPLHWAREKSTDQMNTAFRHMLDHGRGNHKDTDGAWHLAKAIWRLSAELQLAIEAEQNQKPKVLFDDLRDRTNRGVVIGDYGYERNGRPACQHVGHRGYVCTLALGHPGLHKATDVDVEEWAR